MIQKDIRGYRGYTRIHDVYQDTKGYTKIQKDIPGYKRVYLDTIKDIPGYKRIYQDTKGYTKI